MEAIIKSLKRDKSDWAAKQLTIMAGKSPTSQKIAYRQLRDGAKTGFEGCMKIEWRMVNRIYHGHDFFEGDPRRGGGQGQPAGLETGCVGRR